MAKVTETQSDARFSASDLGFAPLRPGWSIVPLGQVALRMKAGGTPRRGVPSYWNGDIPFIKIEDMTRNGVYLTRTEETITKQGLDASSAWLVPENSVLLAMYASIGTVAINQIVAATNQAILAITPDPQRLDTQFLYYVLRDSAARLLRHNVQTTQKNVSRGIVEKFPIPLPPLVEQRSIAATLRALDDEKGKTRGVIASARQLKIAAIQQLFMSGLPPGATRDFKQTGLGPLPSDWDLVPLGSLIATDPQNGMYKPAAAYGGGVPILRIDDFSDEGEVVTTAGSRVALTDAELAKYGLAQDELVVNRVNSLSQLGKVALVGALSEPLVFESNMMRLRVLSERVLPEYLFRFLNAPTARRQILSRAKRAVAQSSINQGDLKSVLCVVPPVHEQTEITSVLSSVDRKIQTELDRLAALDLMSRIALRNLMGGAFTIKQRAGLTA